MAQQLNSPRGIRWLWVIALTSLGLNILTILVLLIVRGLLSQVLPQANQHLYNSLQTLENYEGYDLEINLQDQVDLERSDKVLFDRTLTVPVSLEIPFEQNIPFNDIITVPVNQIIHVEDVVQAPLVINGQNVLIDVPVSLDVPINLEIDAPVDTLVPVNTIVPVAFDLDVPVRELIPLVNESGEALTIGLSTTVPVPMDELLDDVSMRPMLEELHKALNLVESLLFLPLPD